MSGWKIIHLSDRVVITLITTTTINVFAFSILVIKYVFAATHEEKKISLTINYIENLRPLYK